MHDHDHSHFDVDQTFQMMNPLLIRLRAHARELMMHADGDYGLFALLRQVGSRLH